jgi:excisionase family DNA binding protein
MGHVTHETTGRPQGGDVLTIEEAAELLHLAPETTYRLARRGQLPGALKLGGRWRVRRDLLMTSFEAAS